MGTTWIDPGVLDPSVSCHGPLLAAMLTLSCAPLVPTRPSQRAGATWQPPLEPVSIRVMYSAPLARLPSSAANFLLLGYTNCAISILRSAAAGSWVFSRHRWPVQAIVIVIPQRPPALFVWVSQTCAASTFDCFFFTPHFLTWPFSQSPISAVVVFMQDLLLILQVG